MTRLVAESTGMNCLLFNRLWRLRPPGQLANELRRKLMAALYWTGR